MALWYWLEFGRQRCEPERAINVSKRSESLSSLPHSQDVHFLVVIHYERRIKNLCLTASASFVCFVYLPRPVDIEFNHIDFFNPSEGVSLQSFSIKIDN